jgi:catechol 2,3-dioxygenase-like lactoylglutathione lyase family enzyme
MVKVTALNHVGLRVSDAKRTKEFYAKVLGLPTMERPNFPFDGAWYGIGQNMIHIIESKAGGRKIDPAGPHIALDVDNLDEAKKELDRLGIEYLDGSAAGFAIGNPDRRLTGRQLWFLDPDGNTIELRSA